MEEVASTLHPYVHVMNLKNMLNFFKQSIMY